MIIGLVAVILCLRGIHPLSFVQLVTGVFSFISEFYILFSCNIPAVNGFLEWL